MLDRLVKSKGLVFVITAAAVAQAPEVAFSQTTEARDIVLEEITVTARKREEKLMDVPFAITPITEKMIEETGINSVTELAQQTPGLSFRPGFGRIGSGQGGGASSRPAIRGQANILGLPNVGFFVDGVYVSGNITSYQIDNLQALEVYRGPQSALFGRGTFAGAVNFITRKPGNEVKGKVEATVGGYGLRELTGYVSGPLVENTLFGEISWRDYSRGGDWTNRATGKKEGGAESSQNVGLKLYWTPSDAFDVELNTGYAKDVDDTFAGGYSGTNCLLPTIVATVPLPRSSTRRTGYYCGEVNIDGETFFSRTDVLALFGLDSVNRETFRSSIKANYTVNDWTVTGIAAYNRYRNLNAFESGFSNSEKAGRPVGLSASQDRRKDWSLELRAASPAMGRFRTVVGAYMYREDDLDGFAGVFGGVPTSGAIPLYDPRWTFTKTPTIDDSAVRNRSIFTSIDFEVSDRLTLTAEGRYQIDRIITDQLRNATIASNLTNPLLEKDFKKFLPRITGLFKLSPTWNVYANVADGNKPGGFNSLPTNASAASLAELQAAVQSYDEEDARTYELGVKGGNEARTVQLSASIYQIDWEKQQLTRPILYTTISNTPNNSTTITNAGESRIRGAELDLNYSVSDNLNLRAAYSYIDAKIIDFVDIITEDIYDTDGRVQGFDRAGDPTGQVAGASLPQQPKNQIILTADYHGQVTEGMRGFFRGDYTIESKRYDQVHNLAHTGESKLLNLRAGVELGDWTVTLWVNNALDDRTPVVLTRLLDFSRPLQIPPVIPGNANQTTFYRDLQVSYPRKRAGGLTVKYAF